jgi:histidinol-phosphatase (PHP family)
VHYVKGEIINQQLLAKRNLKEIYKEYFDEVEKSVESRLFDVVGHLDIVRKYVANGVIQRENLERKKLEAILEEIRDSKMFLEINSKPSVLRHGLLETLPSKETIRIYFDYGGKHISIGSDAHSVKELGSGIKETFEFLAQNSQINIYLLFEKEQVTYLNNI